MAFRIRRTIVSNKKRIEELKAEIARLEKEDEFHPYLAWVSDSEKFPNKSNARIALIINEDLYDNRKVIWKYVTPLTRSEILAYLPSVKSKYDWDAILEEYPEARVAVRNKDNSFNIGTYREVDVYGNVWEGHGEGLWNLSDKNEWILDKDCDWEDSIEYLRDVR